MMNILGVEKTGGHIKDYLVSAMGGFSTTFVRVPDSEIEKYLK